VPPLLVLFDFLLMLARGTLSGAIRMNALELPVKLVTGADSATIGA